MALTRRVEKEFSEAFSRPMELSDVNPGVCLFLIMRNKQKDKRESVMKSRKKWFSERNAVTVSGGTRKGRTRDKLFRLRPETVQRIEAIKVFAQEEVFLWPYCQNYIFAKFGKVLEAASLPNNSRSKFHKQRRTVATNFEAAGGNASQLLDHAHRRTTKKYIDPRVIREIHPADIVPGIGQSTTPEDPKSEKEPSEDAMLDEFRQFLRSKRK